MMPFISIFSLFAALCVTHVWAQNSSTQSSGSPHLPPGASRPYGPSNIPEIPAPSVPVKQTQSLDTQAIDEREEERSRRNAPTLQPRKQQERYPSVNTPSHLTPPSNPQQLPPVPSAPESTGGVKRYP